MKKAPQVNSLVVFNHSLDAAVFRVKQVEGFHVGVIDRSLEDSCPNQAIQWVDKSSLLSPSVGQLARWTR